VSDLLATEHVVAVAVVCGLAAAFVITARLRPGPWLTVATRGLALLLVAAEVAWWTYLLTGGSAKYPLATALPLQLCDAAIFVGAAALWFQRPLLIEITYFWGLAGTLQALITPDLPDHFPSFPFFQYYAAHGGIVAAALLLVVGLRLAPRRGAVVRVAAITLGYAAFVGAIDAVTGFDYLYLRSKPPSPTLFDYLGPWPWYIASAIGIGVVLFLIIDAPFRVGGRRRPGPSFDDPG
jgi:hypothetical integral membrane protein (TIGR02206 family)